jgi:hypothetical protein
MLEAGEEGNYPLTPASQKNGKNLDLETGSVQKTLPSLGGYGVFKRRAIVRPNKHPYPSPPKTGVRQLKRVI